MSKSSRQDPGRREQERQVEDRQDEERQDDAVIGRAFRTSAVALVVIVALGVGIFFYLNRPEESAPEVKTAISAPVVPDRVTAQLPKVAFTDITTDAGIHFVHNNGATGDKLLPESLGGGVAFFDYNGDGKPDLLFVNSTGWRWDREEHPSLEATTAALYRNDTPPGGKVVFSDVTAGSGLDVPVHGMGVSVADYDNDGRPDVFLTCVGENHLFRNVGKGHFDEVTSKAGVAGDTGDWSTASAFFDYDNDGMLDLFVVNYVKWSRELDFKVNFTIDGTHRAYGPPTDFEGAFARLYHNEGDGTFDDVSGPSGVQVRNAATGVPVAKSLGVSPVDIDGDGWMDLMVANDTTPNQLFINQGDGTFDEQGAIAGVAYDSSGNTRGAMGIDIAHYRNSADLGIAIGNFANEMTSLFVSQGQPMLFADEAIAEGIGPASRLLLKFGIFFFDYDLDGWLDLLSVNGHLDEDITKVQASQAYRQPAQLFWNNRGAGFLLTSAKEMGPDLFKPIVGRGSANADIDGDGDLDVVFAQLAGPPLLLRNDQALSHSFLRLKLSGRASNRDSIGAVVELSAGGITQTQQVMPTKSYLSRSDSVLTFGLGKAETIDSLRIRWPSGGEQLIEGRTLRLNTTVAIRE